MRFIGLQENLKQGLQIVGHIVSKNINLPVLNNILFKVNKGQIELIATNLEVGITHTMRGSVDLDGDFTVNSKVMADYINLLPSDKVEIEQVGEEIKVGCQNYKTKIKIQSAQDFPLLPVVNKDKFFGIGLDDFRDALNQVIFAVANNETRVELSGVLMIFDKNNLTLVGTDSYRLAEKVLKIKNNYGEESVRVIVPARTLQELIRVLSVFKEEEQLEAGGEIKISLSENQILFSFGTTELVSRLVSGSYPDYKQIIPVNSQTQIVVVKNDLVRAIKASSIFSKVGINDISLRFKKEEQQILISSASSQVGESDINLKAEISGVENELVINYRYLLDGLNNINDATVKIEIISGSAPALLRAAHPDDYQYVVMPIRQ